MQRSRNTRQERSPQSRDIQQKRNPKSSDIRRESGVGDGRNRKIKRKRDSRDNVKIGSGGREKQGGRTESGTKGKPDIAAHISASQNFITSGSLIRRIIRLSGIEKSDTVLEIGTGKGHLTEALCREAGYVHSIEIDRKLYDTAGKRLSKYENLQLICGDFLQYKLPDHGDYLVFANIPYCITTQIFEKLTKSVNRPRHIWLIMEKGAAKRFMGLPQETEKSLQMKVYWDSEIRYFFRRDDFHPMPSVDSVLAHFSLKQEPDLNPKEYRDFCRFVKEGRKRGICGKGGLLTNRQAQAALKRAGLPHAHEDGVTLYIQWLCLFRCWQAEQKH